MPMQRRPVSAPRALATLRSNQDMLQKIDFDRFPSILGPIMDVCPIMSVYICCWTAC